VEKTARMRLAARPSSEVMKDDLPRREVVRQKAPRAAAPQYVEDRVEDLAGAVDFRLFMSFEGRYVRLDIAPFFIREVGWVRRSHNC
jgi:hypothetical protein